MAVVDGVTQDSMGEADEEAAPIEVLVVDDDPEIADLVRIFLERTDDALSVTVATDASTGLAKVREQRFDAVVSDYHMPTMDGLSLIDRLGDAEPTPPGILFSSDDAPEVVEAARDADVPYVRKRMRPEQFERLASDVRAAVRDR